MKAGFSRIDITPAYPVWMDGMLRSHPSTGVHDPIYAKALVLCNGSDLRDAVAIVSLDICGLFTHDCLRIRQTISGRTGLPVSRIIIAATHTHSGPAARGFFGHQEKAYLEEMSNKTVLAVKKAVDNMVPVAVGCGSGVENTISHYRRLLADDGHVVMNWEPWPAERIVHPLGVIDPEVGVLKVVADNASAAPLGLIFNHAGHPNVLSGDNYLISADYPGLAEAILEKELGGTAIFVNGAQGTMDIDGLKDRDWQGLERVGRALAKAVATTARQIVPSSSSKLQVMSENYTIPARKITESEMKWAKDILRKTGGRVQPVADGVGDDYKAQLYQKLREVQHQAVAIEQICTAIDDCAFLSFPGELFTEIGMFIKTRSPFRHTYIIGLANGVVSYVPTRKAIPQGGYEVDTRKLDDSAEDIIVEKSLALLQSVHRLS
jgi:hypothetical protein